MKCQFFSGMYEIFRSVIRTQPGSYSLNIEKLISSHIHSHNEINLSDTIFINFLEFSYIPWPTIHVSIAPNTGPNTLSPRSKLAVTQNLQVLSLLANYWCCTLSYPLVLFYDTTALFTSKSLIILLSLSETLESSFWLIWINFLSGLVC